MLAIISAHTVFRPSREANGAGDESAALAARPRHRERKSVSKQGGVDKTLTFPFGSYDVFSYLIPGATAILGIVNFEHWYRKIVDGPALTPVLSTLLGPAETISGNQTANAIAFAAVLLCVIYVSGHIVSSVSSFFLDRIYVAKAKGYPYETLLLLPRTSGPGFRRADSKGFYQGTFFWVNLYLILRFLTFFLALPWLPVTLRAVEFIIAAAAVGKLAAGILRGIPSTKLYTYLARPGPRRWLVQPVRYYLSKLFPLPFEAISKSIENHVRTGRPFEPSMRERYFRIFQAKFGIDPLRAGSDNFWLCKMSIAHESPEFNRNLMYWLDMYTYARNLATACYVAFLYCFFFIYLQFPRAPIDERNLFVLISIPLGYFLMAGVLAVRFRYIYVGYYNRFLYRCFIFLGTEPSRPDLAVLPYSGRDVEPVVGQGHGLAGAQALQMQAVFARSDELPG